jgi:RNA polymerase sigma-70 factor, ECF subfamily
MAGTVSASVSKCQCVSRADADAFVTLTRYEPLTMSDVFAENRALLFGVAYRMLGAVADAEDMVQETFLRWQKQDAAKVDSAKAWLVATITRLSIDQLRSARRKREEYVGVWLPEPLVAESDGASPQKAAALTDSLGLAFMHLLEDLNPLERAVFLLREIFDYDYAEIATIVGKSEANCRQLFSRAKAHLTQRELREEPAGEKAERVVQQFLEACATGDMQSFLAVLTDDAVLYSDGGGKVKSALKPIYSAIFIGRFYMGIRRRALAGAQVSIVRVNGKIGAVTRRLDGRVHVSAFAFEGDRIKAVYMVNNPEKLGALAMSGLRQTSVSNVAE